MNIIDKTNELLKNYDYISELEGSFYGINEDPTIEEIKEALQQRIYETDVIYYSNAMNFLIDEDCSLATSIELAVDMGIELANINSETLATLLKQSLMNEELCELIEELGVDYE